MMLMISVIVILAVCVAMTWTDGLWTNTLTCINAFFAAVVASNYYEPVASFMDEQLPSFTYFWDFLSLWALYALAFMVLRICTDQSSKTRVRFKLPVDRFGAGIAGLCIGWMVVCFFLFSVHLAPLSRSPFRGKFQETPTSSNFFLSPDRLWLGFLQSRSEGAMSTIEPKVFDEESEFILKYGQRRQTFSKQKKMRVKQ